MTQTPNRRPTTGAPASRVHQPTDGIVTRRIRLHHTLVRRRRWSKELDQICGRMVRCG